MLTITRRSLIATSAAALAFPGRAAASSIQRGWIGTYTYKPGEGPPALGKHKQSDGIYGFDLDTRTGRLSELWLAAKQPSPANLIVHPTKRVIYSAQGGEFGPAGEATLSALSVEGATLRSLKTVSAGGTGPTHGAVDRRGRFLVTTNFSSDEIVAFRLARDGSIVERTARIVSTDGPKPPPPLPGSPLPPTPAACRTTARDPALGCRTKPHIALFSPSERWVVVAEIATDALAIYRFDHGSGALVLHSVAQGQEGGGPRHLAWGRDGRFLYSSDEHGSQVSVWRWIERSGTAVRLQTLSTLPAGFAGHNTTAHIAIHPSGQALWVSNRGHPSLAGFKIDQRTGLLTEAGHALTDSPHSWCFDFDRTGRWLIAALIFTDEIVAFRVDASKAVLEPTGQRVSAPFPTCLRMV